MLEDVLFEDFFDRVRELHARVREEFYAVILVGIVGGGDDDAGLKIILANQACDAWSGDDTCEGDGCAGLREARR